MTLFLDLYENMHTRRASVADLRQPARDIVSLPPKCPKLVGGLRVRAMGLGLVTVAILSIRMLTNSVAAGSAHSATPLEFAIAFVAVVTALLGNLLLWEGGKINEPCEVSGRWRRHH